jgi:hypothetical protein
MTAAPMISDEAVDKATWALARLEWPGAESDAELLALCGDDMWRELRRNARAALTAALPFIAEEMAKVAEDADWDDRDEHPCRYFAKAIRAAGGKS